jgi:hypothetical protein
MELCLVKRPLALIASLAAVLCFTSGNAHAQVAGESVNMVSGIAWPGGDPFLQRQNEPTMAVSSVNPMHLMAGANDYRSVDIKVPDADVTKINGDAWLGVFKSLDGGQNWKSVLLPGYVQDTGCAIAATPAPAGHVHHNRCGHTTAAPSVGGQFALCGLPASADPVMRAGTDGMFFLAGINFQRDKLKSRMFLARYIDLNNKENGDATKATDPIRYVDTRIIADNPPNVFIDKPWMTVDVPRAGAAWCEIPISDIASAPPRRFLGGTIYVGWSEFTLPDDLPTTTSTIKFTYSTDCGKTWVTPYALNSRNSVLNQGLTLAVEPTTGRVYAAWRRIATSTNKQTDAIMATRSGGRKKNFSNPRVVAKLTTPFDQGTSYTVFRTEAFPVMAISTDGTSSWAHLAWQQRKAGTPFESRIVMSTAKVHPPPVGEDDPDEVEDLDDETRLAWSLPKAVDDHDTFVGDDAGNVFASGHQVMPALTFGQGKLMLVYYDTRFDHTRRYFEPLATPTADGRFYKETLAPVGELARATDPLGAPAVPVAVFNSWINDGSLFRVRHTVDVRVASAPAGGNPVFTSALASKFPFGIRGDEGAYTSTGLKVPGFGATDVEVVTAPLTDAATKKVTPGTLKVLQQLQSNPPNFPLFKNGSKAFMGDYIDIQGQTFVPTQQGGWAFNSAPTAAPVFHAVWTSNQDVQVPRVTDAKGFPDWTQYAPPYCATCNAPQASRYANNGTTLADKCVPGAEASRDQNIYTSRITEGLLVATPQNMKPLSPTATRAFVIVAQNSSDKDMVVSFAATVPSQGAPASVPAVDYAFTSDLALANRTLGAITVPKRSYVTRSLFVKLPAATSNPLTTMNVSVTETGCAVGACRSGFVTLNPASALGSLVQPDTSLPAMDITVSDAFKSAMASAGLTDPNWINGGKTDPTWINPTWINTASNPTWVNLGYSDPTWINSGWSDPTWINPPLTNSNWANGAWTSPTWINTTWTNPGFTDPTWINPAYTEPTWINPTWINPTWINPTWINPTWINPTWINPTWVNSSMSDLTYTITNTGNTTTSYHVKVVGPASTATPPAQPPPQVQMNMTKWYNTPASVNCKLIEVPRFLPVVEVPNMPLTPANSIVDPGATDGSASNATVALAPGESALIVLRANVPMKDMAALGSTIGVASVPASYTPTTTTYQDLQASGNGSTVGVGRTSTTTLTYAPASATATVTVTGGTPTPTGAIVVIRNGKQLAATYPLSAGVATVGYNPAPAPGDTLAAYYAGDGVYMASTSSTAQVGGVTVTISPTTLNLVTYQEQVFTAAVTGSADTAVAWSVTPATGTTGASISDTGNFAAWIPGTYTVTATSRADPSVSASETFTVAPAPLGITGRITDGRFQIFITQGYGGYDPATVTVTTSSGTTTLVRYGTGFYENQYAAPLPPAGGTVTLTVTGPWSTPVTGTATIPIAPTVTAPALNSMPPGASPITAQWTSTAPDPQEFWLDGSCGTDPCKPGPIYYPPKWATVPGSARSAVLPTNFFTPSTKSVFMALYASNSIAFTGNVLPASKVEVLARATPTWWEFIPSFPGTWIVSANSMPTARFAHGVATDGASKIWVVGGMKYTAPDALGHIYYDQSATVASVESTDVRVDYWNLVIPPPFSVPPATPFYPAAVQTGTGLFLMGGQSGASTIGLRSYLEYNWGSNSWWVPDGTVWPWMVTPRTMAAAAGTSLKICLSVNPDSNCFHVMVTGGYSGGALGSTELTNGNGAWFAGAPLNTSRYDHAAIMVGNRYFAIGGRDSTGAAISDMEYCDVYVDTAGTWHTTAWTTVPMPAGAGRYGSAAAALNGKVYVMGGAANTQVRSEVYVLDVATLTWSQGQNLAIPVAQAGAAVLGGRIFLVGGDKGNPAGANGQVQALAP